LAPQLPRWCRWPETDATRIHSTVDNGIVTLEGSVDALWKKVHAEEIVLNLTGVLGVDNHLTVVPAKKFADQAIAEDIMAAIDRNLLINPDAVVVKVENGVATLTGAVATPAVRRAAYEAAIYTSGVVDVRDELTTLLLPFHIPTSFR
jgi:osmotically-inducible protein OsmY